MFIKLLTDTIREELEGSGERIRRDYYRAGDVIDVDVAEANALINDDEAETTALTTVATPFRVRYIDNPEYGNVADSVFPPTKIGVLTNDGYGNLSWAVVSASGGTGNTSVLTDNGDGTFTHDDGTGNSATFFGGADVLTSLAYDAANAILSYVDENGNPTNVDLSALGAETVTALSYDAATYVLSFADENGAVTAIDLSALAGSDHLTGGSFDPATNVLTLTDGDAGTADILIDLSSLVVQLDDATAAATDATGDGGSATTAARSDHRHAAQGVSADAGNLLKAGSDGLHLLDPADLVQPADAVSPAADDAAGAVGAGTEYAREDHKHPAQGVSADAGNSLSVGSDGLHHFEETVTDLEFNAATRELEFTDETGTQQNLDLSMVGADGTNPGAKGFAPQPGATDNDKFLRGDGTWATPSGSANDHVFAGETFINPATAGSPTEAEIAAKVVENDVVIFYTGTNVSTDPVTYVFHKDASGNVVTLEKPISIGGLTDVAVAAPATIAWLTHTVINSASPGDVITIADASALAVGDYMEVYNASTETLTLDIGVNALIGNAVAAEVPPESGFTVRKVSATEIEVVGTGEPIITNPGQSGHIIIGDIMLQWGHGTSTSDSDQTFTFPVAFGGVPYNVTPTPRSVVNTNAGLSNTDTISSEVPVVAVTAADFTVNRDDDISGTLEFNYIAIGPKP